MVKSAYRWLWRKKLGGGCLSTILLFFVIYWALGQCNRPATQPQRTEIRVEQPVKTAALLTP